MERLDKVISNQTEYSRKDVKKIVNQQRVTVNDILVKDSDMKIDSNKDIIKIDGKEISIKEFVYLVLNKPKGYISATEDRTQTTVLDLVPNEFSHRNLFPAGRLDKDTTGLMIITDDGNFVHNILAPKKHVKKVYEADIDIPITQEMIDGFKNGVKLKDGECKTSLLEIISEKKARVTLTEGRYHQVKRMFAYYGANVIELHRIKIGEFDLPENLEQGKCRELTSDELELIQKR